MLWKCRVTVSIIDFHGLVMRCRDEHTETKRRDDDSINGYDRRMARGGVQHVKLTMLAPREQDDLTLSPRIHGRGHPEQSAHRPEEIHAHDGPDPERPESGRLLHHLEIPLLGCDVDEGDARRDAEEEEECLEEEWGEDWSGGRSGSDKGEKVERCARAGMTLSVLALPASLPARCGPGAHLGRR